MKILVITDLYPIKEDERYTPRTIEAFVKEWEKQGHEVKVIKPNFILNSFLRKKPFYKSGIYNNVENINYWLPFWGGVNKKVKTIFTPDIVIAHMPSGLIFANKLINQNQISKSCLSAPLEGKVPEGGRGVVFCAAVHSSDIEVLTNPLYRFYFKPELEKAYKNAKKIACRSFVLKEKFLKLYPQFTPKTFVAPSGVGVNIVKKNWHSGNKIKVLTCGQLIKRKNIDKVIRACEQFENVELTVIGSGNEYNKLKNLSDKVLFTGQISHDEVLEKMKESDIFILPSVNETFGMVYLEAMASGCITVCTKNDGIDGIIKDGFNGFTTEVNVDDIKDTLQKIINSQNKNEILNNTYNTILEYTLEKAAENYLKNITDY